MYVQFCTISAVITASALIYCVLYRVVGNTVVLRQLSLSVGTLVDVRLKGLLHVLVLRYSNQALGQVDKPNADIEASERLASFLGTLFVKKEVTDTDAKVLAAVAARRPDLSGESTTLQDHTVHNTTVAFSGDLSANC